MIGNNIQDGEHKRPLYNKRQERLIQFGFLGRRLFEKIRPYFMGSYFARLVVVRFGFHHFAELFFMTYYEEQPPPVLHPTLCINNPNQNRIYIMRKSCAKEELVIEARNQCRFRNRPAYMEEKHNLYGQFAYIVLHYEAKMLLPNSIFIWQFIYVTFRRDLVLHFGSLLLLSTVITFEASMLGPTCNNGFITFRTNDLLHLRPKLYYI